MQGLIGSFRHATDYRHIIYRLVQSVPLTSRPEHCEEVAELKEDQEILFFFIG